MVIGFPANPLAPALFKVIIRRSQVQVLPGPRERFAFLGSLRSKLPRTAITSESLLGFVSIDLTVLDGGKRSTPHQPPSLLQYPAGPVIQKGGRILGGARVQVCVFLGDGDAGMTKLLSHKFQMSALIDHEGGGGVPQIVYAEFGWNPGYLHGWFPYSGVEVGVP
jgi:hypothetical protein